MIKHIVKKFSTPGSPTILVFPYQTAWQYSDGDPPNGGAKWKGVRKKCTFLPISRYISLTIQQTTIVTIEGE